MLALCLFATSAQADCQPDAAVSGQTVTCSGNDANGFAAGGGVTNLTVNVLTGATVNDNGTAAINVNDTNVVINNGTVTAGSGLTGINGGNFNTVTTNNSITVIDNGLGISMLNNNTIANNGTITTGDGGSAVSVQDNNVITNAGALSVGANGSGIFAGLGNTITNSAGGTIDRPSTARSAFMFSATRPSPMPARSRSAPRRDYPAEFLRSTTATRSPTRRPARSPSVKAPWVSLRKAIPRPSTTPVSSMLRSLAWASL